MCRHEALMFALMFAHYVLSENTIIVVDSPIEGERVALRGVLFLVRIANGMAHDFEVALSVAEYLCRRLLALYDQVCLHAAGEHQCAHRLRTAGSAELICFHDGDHSIVATARHVPPPREALVRLPARHAPSQLSYASRFVLAC